MRSYKYRPLSCAKGIRLFIFLPLQSRRKPGIKVDLIKTTLPEHPPYDALSYTLGDLLEKVAIDVDGSSLDVTPNLHTFLGYLQQEAVTSNKPRYFWADQICIYSHRTTMNYFESLRFVPRFFEGLILRIWLVRSGNTFVCVFNLLSLQP
jgi:hypothetical protein